MRMFKTVLALIAMLALTAPAYAQRCGCAAPGSAMGAYNGATEITITGTVDEAKSIAPSGGGMGGGLHLVLNASAGSVEVHVGPIWFVTSKNVTFAKGDVVSVVGSQMKMSGQEFVVAREIRKGDQVLTLRDSNGLPLWSGQRRTR